ncbi:restriction endonuclease subunit S [uncultured Thiodictyon sp.]|uniref:restriction endonuclease subunit S n=1 Tax=uncultured Thiodictyon sp. TaxID=1846217 RepID=UPI0025FEA586|nr:restriction endonuclease subunit S [uncultured Thiodictyon sp.]
MLDDAGPYPVYGSNGVIGHSIAFNQESSIILGRVGAYCGSVNYEAGKYWSTDNTIVVNATKENDTLFFQYLLRSYPLNSLAGGSAQPLINHKTISRIQAWVPPLATQRKIAAILTAYDDLIEINKRRIDVLEKMAEEIYREWFVRMRFPGYQNTKITKGVPEGWERKKFGEFCMLKRGYDLPNDLLEEGPYPVVASTSVKAFHKHYKVEPPVITTGRSGSLGDVLMTHTRAWPLNTALYVRNFFGNSPFLVFYTLKNMGLEKFDSGAGVPTLNRNHVSGIPMVVPERSLQQRFDGIVAPIHQQVETLRQENTNLTKTRDLLLPRLISGKLSVADLDIQFPPSMREDGKGQGGGDAPS